MIRDNINFVDVTIILFFLALFLLVPKIMSRTTNHSDVDYLLMGRRLSLPLFVATLVATWYGGILGVTQIAFLEGAYSFFTQGLFWYIAYGFFALFLVKKIRKDNVLSLPELIGRKFGPKSRKLSALILFFHALPVTYSISIGIVIELCLGIDFVYAQILGVGIVSLYTAMGGLKGVVITDLLQFILMFVAVIMVVVACYYQIGDFDFLKSHVPTTHFSWRGSNSWSDALIWFFIATTSTLIHPVFYQRSLAAKSDTTAIIGIFIAMAFWFLFDLCTMLGGMYARALLPDADSATSYLSLGMQVLPHGLRGLFLTGIIGTILSTLDSFLFVSGTSISYDLLGKNRRAHHLSIIACGALIAGVGFFFKRDFETIWLFFEGAFSTSLFMAVIALIFVKRKLGEINFLIPASSALFVFFVSSILKAYGIFIFQPFYLAHLTGFLAFLCCLVHFKFLKTFKALYMFNVKEMPK